MEQIPRVVYEDTMARFERTVKRLIIALVITVVLMFASNAFWLYEWNQYDYEGVTIDGVEGTANYLKAGANGTINNGEDSSSKASQEE